MPLLIPLLIGIPVVVGGGWVIYQFVHYHVRSVTLPPSG